MWARRWIFCHLNVSASHTNGEQAPGVSHLVSLLYKLKYIFLYEWLKHKKRVQPKANKSCSDIHWRETRWAARSTHWQSDTIWVTAAADEPQPLDAATAEISSDLIRKMLRKKKKVVYQTHGVRAKSFFFPSICDQRKCLRGEKKTNRKCWILSASCISCL